MQSVSGFIREIETDVEGLWKLERPTLEAGLANIYEDSIPILKTALGQLAVTVVTNLQSVAATDSVGAAKQASDQIIAGAKAQGVTLGKNEVNLLITLAIAQLKGLVSAS